MSLGKKLLIAIIAIVLLLPLTYTAFKIQGRTPAEKEPNFESEEKIPVKVLILPKFEVDEMSGDFPGEAQLYYEHYLDGAEEYEAQNAAEGCTLYLKDGVALCVLGMGKVNAALNTMAILTDSRFDFSDAYILSTGCAGSAMGSSVMGDVFVITSAVDYDLGHHADPRDMEDDTAATWFHDADFDSAAVVHLDSDLMDRVYSLVKDIPLETTERTRDFMTRAFDGADWAVRDPKVLRGTTVTGDNYWKGQYDHANALLMTQTYRCPDPYATTEMEDIAIARTAKQLGMLDRLIILRDSVNMDTFMLGATPESLWDPAHDNSDVSNENSEEYIDIFATARENNFIVGRTIIDAILEGKF
jgi:purine nucleoside permease